MVMGRACTSGKKRSRRRREMEDERILVLETRSGNTNNGFS